MSTRYPWKRFWCPTDASYSLSPDGYLVDPDGSDGSIRQPHALSAVELDAVPCLALWGDPGLGKSTTLDDFRSLASQKGMVIDENLAIGRNADRLHDLLFGLTFQTWANSDDTLTILLDGLDECLSRHPDVPLMMIDELRRGYPLNRLRLRITCRGTEWPPLLTEKLQELWGDQNFMIAELLPLRRCDVEVAAAAGDLPVQNFLDEVSLRGMQPFAIRPNSLTMLFDAFRRGNGQLNRDQVGMFRDYCRTLCIEHPGSTRRLLSRPAPDEGDQFLAAARRIAAVTIFSDRRSIIADSYYESSKADGDVALSELVGGTEMAGSREVTIDPELLQRCIQSGLFTPHGESRRLWSHWSYPEFLAADFLVVRGVSSQQIEGLLFAPGVAESDQPKVIPQLAETAAWLAMMDTDLRTTIIRNDPQILLRSQVVSADQDSKHLLVESILQAADNGLFFGGRVPVEDYRVLGHEQLADQLVPWVGAPSKNTEARRVAMNIAEANSPANCESTLRSVLFNSNEPRLIRRESLDAWLKVAEESQKACLIALLEELDNDDDDELRGRLLEALWPSQLSTEEMFRHVTVPKRENLIGNYAMFLRKTIPERLIVNVLPAALEWLTTLFPEEEPVRRFEDLEIHIVNAALESAQNEKVFESLAQLTCYWVFGPSRYGERDFYDQIAKPLQDAPELRHRLLRRLVSHAADSSVNLERRWHDLRSMYRSDELPTILDAFESAKSDAEARIWGELVSLGVHDADQGAIERVLQLREANPVFRAATELTCGAVALNSERADRLQRFHNEERERESRRGSSRPKAATHPPVNEIVAQYLDRIEAGDLDLWWQLHRLMTLRNDSDRFEFQLEYVSDLTSLEAWPTLDVGLIQRCVDVAEKWLREANPDNEEWLSTTTFNRPTAAGFRSLRLLHTLAPERLTSLPTHVWEKWAPCAATFEDWQDQDSSRYQSLLRDCYHNAPDQFIDAIQRQIEQLDNRRSCVPGLYRLRSVWDERLITAVVDRFLHQPTLQSESSIDILGAIAPRKSLTVYRVLADIFDADKEKWSAEVRQHAGALLVAYFHDQGWRKVFPILEQHSAEAHRIVELLADKYEDGLRSESSERDQYQLSPELLGDFYLWLSREYPHDEDEKHDEAHFVSGREHIQMLREGIFSSLRASGATESVNQLRRIRDELPQLTWMQRAVTEAELIARRQSRKSVSTFEIIHINMKEPHVSAPMNNAGDVRRLVEQSLTADEFSTLCFDHFSDVYNQFTDSQTHTLRIRLLIDYASRRKRLGDVVSAVRAMNPGADGGDVVGVETGQTQTQAGAVETVDVVVITALEEELKAVLDKLSDVEQLPPSKENVRVFYRATVAQPEGRRPLNLRLTCLAGMGRVKAANVTNDAVRQWQPSNVILTGIAGGVAANEASLGDVLIAEQIVDYELQKVMPKGPSYRFQVYPVDERLRTFACTMQPEEWRPAIQVERPQSGFPDMIRGPIATGDKVVEAPRLLKQLLKAFPKLVGVEMEAGGAVSAVVESVDRPGFFMIRGVSDLADPDKESSEVKSWRSYACDVAAAFTISLLRKGPLPQD